MGMRSFLSDPRLVSPRKHGIPKRSRSGARSLERAVRHSAELLETRFLFANIVATLTPNPAATATTGNTEPVIVTYVDPNVGNVPFGFSGSDLAVTAVGTSLPTVEGNPAVTVTGTTAVVTYTILAPGGTNWTAAENGNYQLALNAPGVTDASGSVVTQVPIPDFGSFTVGVPPTAALTSAPQVNTLSTENIVVTYTDVGSEIDAGSLDTTNITVNGPNGPNSVALQVASVTATDVATAESDTEVVTYTVDAPGGGNFDAADNGTYTIGLAATVTDIVGNPVVANAAFGTFTVHVDQPVAVLSAAPTVAVPGSNTESITVTYSDPGAPAVLVDGVFSLGTNNISVVSPAGAPALTITSISPAIQGNGSPVTVTYTASLGGEETWTAADNGVYTIELNDTVKNTLGNPITADAAFGTFTVDVADRTPPIAILTAPTLNISNAPTYPLVVTYVDDVGVLTSSIENAGTNAVTVIDPTSGENLRVVDETIATGTQINAKTITVTYTLQEPNDVNFSGLDNGTYIVALTGGPDAITDTTGHAIPANPHLGTFTIDIGDRTRPQATVTAPTISTNGVTGETITFVITSGTGTTTVGNTGNGTIGIVTTGTAGVGIDNSSIQLNNLHVVSSNGITLTPTSLSLSTPDNATTITAIYTVAAPFGTFTPPDNGTYTVKLSGVTDVAGLAVLPAGLTTTFLVAVSNPQQPFIVGQFGTVNGTNQKLKFHDIPAGSYLTFSATGGTVTVTEEPNGGLEMSMVDSGGGLNVSLQARSARSITLDGVTVNGTIDSLKANTTNLVGVFQATGSIDSATFAHLDGDLVATGQILSVKVIRAVTASEILSGVGFGADGIFGVNPTTLIDDDTYGAGYIGSVVVGGRIADSVFAAGDNPGPDGLFGTGDDIQAGTALSTINNVTAVNADSISRFLAGAFGIFKFRGKKFQPNSGVDPRFVTLL